MSATMLKTLIHSVIVHGKLPTLVGSHFSNPEEATLQQRDIKAEASLVLTGLHACGDLSVTMLKSFSECEDIKSVVSLGCCYNLLSEEVLTNSDSQYGFPISNAVKCAGLRLGKCSRDLACQSADRWRNLGDKSGIHNFELHVFRAAFQMVLDKYYPKISSTCPAIGRQGKSLQRQKWRGSHESGLDHEHNVTVNLDRKQVTSNEVTISESSELIGGDSAFIVLDQNGSCYVNSTSNTVGFDGTGDTKLLSLWNEIELFTGLVGPYWSLLAALGPLVETLILLDRLLYLQEQGSQVEAFMLPVFNPVLSPRNVAIIAKKHLNFKKRDACQKCSYSKLEAPPIDQCSRQPEVLAGDWYCGAINCSAHNYANRLNCYQCGALKNFDGVSQMMAMGGGHSSFYDKDVAHTTTLAGQNATSAKHLGIEKRVVAEDAFELGGLKVVLKSIKSAGMNEWDRLPEVSSAFERATSGVGVEEPVRRISAAVCVMERQTPGEGPGGALGDDVFPSERDVVLLGYKEEILTH
ncbi:unnamed protein product [Rhodiola kirilowii]